MKFIIKLIFIIATLFLPLSDTLAKQKNKPSGESDARATCVYNYMSCRDGCDYYQNQSQIGPCKAKCDRSYGCRPTKVKRPVDHTPNEPEP